MNEERELPGRQLKIKGVNTGEEKESGKGSKEKKESENKVWVAVILLVSVLISLMFSLRSEKGWFTQMFSRKDTTSSVKVDDGAKESGGGLFGPAVYEFEK